MSHTPRTDAIHIEDDEAREHAQRLERELMDLQRKYVDLARERDRLKEDVHIQQIARKDMDRVATIWTERAEKAEADRAELRKALEPLNRINMAQITHGNFICMMLSREEVSNAHAALARTSENESVLARASG